MKQRETCKTCSLFIGMTFFVIGCTHTTHSPDVLETDLISKNTDTESIYIDKPDYIVPPLEKPDLDIKSNIHSEAYNLQIWNRIANNLSLAQFYEHPRVIAEQEKFLNKKEFLNKVTHKAEPFIYFIVEEVTKRDMPAELAIVPIVESSFRTRARSRARAAGLWQFMSYTAREYGLQTSYGYDARYDVYASTIAALNYLNQLHREFNNDWLLALAAYNAGPKRIKKALKTSDEKNNTFWDLNLPRETQKYVPKILALGSIIQDEARYNSILYPVANIAYFKSIEVNKKISTFKVVEISGVNSTEVRKLNPAIRNFHYPIPKGYNLLVPKDDKELVSLTIENMPEEKFNLWAEHKIRTGESLSTIAESYNITVRDLRLANNLSGSLIKAGHTLLIPPLDGSSTPQIPKSLTKKTSPETRISAEPYIYTVTRGDSFWKIAMRNNTTVERLAEINSRNPNKPLLPGETILID